MKKTRKLGYIILQAVLRRLVVVNRTAVVAGNLAEIVQLQRQALAHVSVLRCVCVERLVVWWSDRENQRSGKQMYSMLFEIVALRTVGFWLRADIRSRRNDWNLYRCRTAWRSGCLIWMFGICYKTHYGSRHERAYLKQSGFHPELTFKSILLPFR